MTSRGPVLALEFHGVGNLADFGFLAESVGQRLIRLDPLADQADRVLPLAEHARVVCDRLPVPPESVIAYCSAALLGGYIAQANGAKLILVDPDPVDPSYVRAEFDVICHTLGCEPGAAGPQPAGSVEWWEATLLQGRDRLRADYGGDEEATELLDDLLDRYRAWLRFLAASAMAGPATTPSGQVTVLAGRPTPPLAGLLADAGSVGQTHYLNTRTATLDSSEAQELLAAIVA